MYYDEIEDLVSIIIPVYNVSEYLDRCMESVVNQTYKNIEILLLNDGSTDDSGMKCFQWAERDNRIVFVSKKNERQGPTRNLALQMAKGKYVVCIDPDDYVSERYVEELYHEIKKHDADMVFCNIIEVINGKEQVLFSNININGVTNIEKEPYIMNNIFLGICGKIYRKGIFLENDIKMSPYALEDYEIHPLLFLHEKRIGQVKLPLYYYVKDRPGNTCDTNSNVQAQVFGKILDKTVGYLIEREMFKEKSSLLKNYFIIGFLVAFYGSNKRGELRKNISMELLEETEKKMSQYFPCWKENLEEYFVCVGNPSAKARINEINAYSKYYSNEFVEMFSFSSLVSMFATDIRMDENMFHITNPFREKMLQKDIQKDLERNAQRILEGKDFIIINLLEERYDLVKYKNTYFTKSGEFDKTDFAKKEQYQVLKRDSKEVCQLFRESCKRFVFLLKKYFKKSQIVLVREYVFEDMMDYDCSCNAERMNEILDEYYDYFEMQLEEQF